MSSSYKPVVLLEDDDENQKRVVDVDVDVDADGVVDASTNKRESPSPGPKPRDSCAPIEVDVDAGVNEREGLPQGRPRRRARREPRKTTRKKFSSAPVGEKEMEELMGMAEYEATQDPYRGMGFLNSSHGDGDSDSDSDSDNGGARTMEEDGNDGTEAAPASATQRGETTSGRVVTPWDVCQWGILSAPKTIPSARQDQEEFRQANKNHGVIGEDESRALVLDDPHNLVRNLTESCCPSILEWTKQRLEEENKKKQQARKSRKQRSTSGTKRNRSTSRNNNNDNHEISPVFARLGMRPSDTNYLCPCDFNPFCLASLGGFMNELLEERCKKGITVTIRDDDVDGSSKNGPSKSCKRTKVIEVDNDEKNETNKNVEILDVDQETKGGASESVSAEGAGILAFLGKVKDMITHGGNEKENTADVLTCTRLGPRWRKPTTGDPAKVFTSEVNISDQYLNDTDYSQITKEEIEKLRKYNDVDLSNIKKVVENILGLCRKSKADTEVMTMDEYIETLTEWHKSLIFVNPTKEERDVASDNITIALPPGIQNLGATCYLNTQLQCLAQNPVFLDGILSWRPVSATHKMNGVMTKLQKLLGEMLVGGDGKYTSLDFSNALGIQHNEQQDPNEFARLLFDRMEESFQQCSTRSCDTKNTSANSNGRGDLGGLLQRIFHGTTTYETICMKCGKTSVRSEGFMDLNLPIVQRQPNEEDETEEFDHDEPKSKGESGDSVSAKRKRRKKGPLETAFRKQRKDTKVATDVQYCFDQYTKAEMLNGDNQYFCEVCDSKQDAKRVMTLTELPPVLNIQLSRYVFDRKKFVKKKLMDEVSLPTVLVINRRGGSDSDLSFPVSSSKRSRSCKKKRYLLCAVMRHQGTSAYSGHYVAEAMDWTTGQWYEFNDETVTMLTAPSCSFIPDTAGNSEEERKSAGSQDAYNMYYVDEEYLGKNAVATMARNQRLNSVLGSNSNRNEYDNYDVLNNLIREKVQRYSVLTQLCTDDYTISDRLRRRKDGIRKYMFGDPSSLLIKRGSIEDDEPYFWVDGKTLREFLSCDRRLDDKLGSKEPIMCSKSLLCPHGYLDPRSARRGKLLRKSQYDSYKSLLVGERKLLCKAIDGKCSDVTGCVITSTDIMTCRHCAQAYSKELSEKLEFVKNVKHLYHDILDETKDATKTFVDDPNEDQTENEYSYIVSRSTISKFKKHVIDAMKSVADFKKGGSLDNTSISIESDSHKILSGIDDLDISSFPGSPTFVSFTKTPKAGNTGTYEWVQDKVNSKITCPHGNCNDFNLRIVRYVHHKTWAKIKKVFPDAIEHKILIYAVDGKMRKPNIDDDGCKQCREERDAINNLTSNVERWAKETKRSVALKNVLDGKNISESEIAVHNFDSAQSNCRLVHRDDIANLCKSVKLLSRLSKLKVPQTMDIKNFVENIAFPSYHSVVLDFEKQPSARLLQSIRSLICCEHKRVIKSAIIDVFGKDGNLEPRYQLSKGVAVLSVEEYDAYVNCLAQLLIILNENYHRHEDVNKSLQDITTSLLDDIKKFSASCHPVIKMKTNANEEVDEILLFSVGGNSKEFSIVPGICEHETCKKDFVPLVQKSSREIVESVSDESLECLGNQKKGVGEKIDCRIGSVAISPIIVESDLEDFTHTAENTQKIRVFQYSEDSELKDAMQSLKTAVGLCNSDDDNGVNVNLRRSTRRRKVKFPVGCITHETRIDIGLHHNVAALRLLLYQNCQISLVCKLSIAVFLDDNSAPKYLDIDYDWSEKTLNDLVDQLNPGDDSIHDLLDSSPSDHFFLLYQKNKDNESGDIETTMMDSLLQVSNAQFPDSRNNSSKGGKTRKKPSERGFQGTLLQSSASSGVTVEQNVLHLDEACYNSETNPTMVEKRPRSNTIISDDEEENSKLDATNCTVTTIPSPTRTSIGHDKQMELVRWLKKVTDSKDESECFEAISWAIKSNPKFNEGEVINAAYEKMLGLTRLKK